MAQITIDFNHIGEVSLNATDLEGHSIDSILRAMIGGVQGLIEGIVPEDNQGAAMQRVVHHLAGDITVHEANIIKDNEDQ